MDFFVHSRSVAKKASYKVDKPTIIISITDPDKELNVFAKNPNIIGVCRLQFDDTDPDIKLKYETLMTPQDASKIKDFVDRHTDKAEQIIVHCEAGISRSAGVMAAIMRYFGYDNNCIFKSHRFSPNMYCYELTAKAFGVYDD